MTYETITKEMIQALTFEVDAVKQGGGSRQIGLQSGLRRGQIPGRYIYAFQLASDLSVLDDTPAQLRVGDQVHDVTVVTVEETTVTLAVTTDLGDRVPTASLNLSPFFLLEALQSRLQEMLKGEIPADRAVAQQLFGTLPNQTLPAGPLVRFDTVEGRLPNQEQMAAVECALGQRVTFIWGPPGTGKTTTINYLVPALMERQERVLITSHTNVAVDEVLKAALKGLTPAEIDRGVVVRLGQPKEPDPAIAHILLDAVVQRRSRDLIQRQAALESQLAATRQERERWVQWEQKLRSLEGVVQANQQAQYRLEAAERRYRECQVEIETIGREQLSRQASRRASRRAAQPAGLLERLLGGLSAERAAAAQREKQARLEQLSAALPGLEQEAAEARRGMALAEQRLSEARRKAAGGGAVPISAQVTGELGRLAADATRLDAELQAVGHQLNAVAAAVVREARVIGATLAKLTVAPELYRSPYDTVIIDEASMIPQPHLWFAGSLATRRVVILGDFRQLAPIAQIGDEADPISIRRMQRDLFVEAGLVAEGSGRPHREDGRLVCLHRQYRMHPMIGELANELVYRADGNPLLHAASAESLAAGLGTQPEPGHPLVLCDTSGADPWAARLEPGYSRYNIYSALVTIRLAAQAAAGAGVTVGVLAPYAAQARLLTVLAAEHGLSDRVQVATVHRFQGSQKDVIIVDLVDGPPFAPGRLLTDPDAARRLFAVALTRAKGKLVLVSNFGYFDHRAREGQVLHLVHQAFGRQTRFVDSRSILTGYGDEAVLAAAQKVRGGRTIGNPEGASFYDEGEFHAAFLQDLAAAGKQVVIFSPFLRAERVAKLATHLRHLIGRGVAVQLVIRADEEKEGGQQALVAELKRLGVTVTARERLHEKVAFVDERVAWFGSLNILSHSRSSEQMIRFTNPDVVAKLMEFSGANRLLKAKRREAEKSELLDALAGALGRLMSPPRCPQCGAPMKLRSGGAGPFYGCTRYPGCRGLVNIPRAALKAAVDALALPCPGCGVGRMLVKWNDRGPFLACDRYPADRTTRPLG